MGSKGWIAPLMGYQNLTGLGCVVCVKTVAWLLISRDFRYMLAAAVMPEKYCVYPVAEIARRDRIGGIG